MDLFLLVRCHRKQLAFQQTDPRLPFYSAALTFLTGFASFWAFPRDSVSGKGKLDLIGSAIGFTGMILFNVAWK